jgi:heme-degrading monooxygenase HmoA
MAVAVEQNFTGATIDQYDQIVGKMGLTPGGATPPGAISHWVAKTDDGMRVVDVWESREAFERFAQEKIGPYSREVGLESEPEIRFYEVHNYLTRA